MLRIHRRRALRQCMLVAVAAVAFWPLGCSQPTTPLPLESPALRLEQQLPTPGHSGRRIASIGSTTNVDVPAVALTGQPLPVAVTTYGGGCITEDTTVVVLQALQADVAPYQRVYSPKQNEACTMELRISRRQVELVFDRPGIATVRVFGRVGPDGSLATVSREVTVK